MSQSEHQDPYGELAESSVAVVALAEIELARVYRAMDSFMQRHRPPAHIRPSGDLAFRITGQSVEIFEIRSKMRGRTPAKAVEAIRVDAARRRLEETTERISAVAEACGFSDEEQMRSTFIRVLGVPPRDYRKHFTATTA